MISLKRSTLSGSTKLLFGTLLGVMALGSTAQQASANPLQAIPMVGELLGVTNNRPVPLPDQLDVFTENVNNNNVSVCVLTCTPGSVPGLPTGARPSQPRPVGARPPVPGQIPPGARPPASVPNGARPTGARPAAPRPSSPSVNVDLSPINIPLK